MYLIQVGGVSYCIEFGTLKATALLLTLLVCQLRRFLIKGLFLSEDAGHKSLNVFECTDSTETVEMIL